MHLLCCHVVLLCANALFHNNVEHFCLPYYVIIDQVPEGYLIKLNQIESALL